MSELEFHPVADIFPMMSRKPAHATAESAPGHDQEGAGWTG